MDRKLIYRVLLKVMILIAATFLVYTFTADFMKGRDDDDQRDSIQVDVTPLAAGQDMRVRWQGQGIIVLSRSKETQRRLREQETGLADPYSRHSRQPEGTEHPLRALNDTYLVAWLPEMGPDCRLDYTPPGPVNPGRLSNTCTGQAYDLSGRAIGQGRNLDIPEHRWLSPGLLVILR